MIQISGFQCTQPLGNKLANRDVNRKVSFKGDHSDCKSDIDKIDLGAAMAIGATLGYLGAEPVTQEIHIIPNKKIIVGTVLNTLKKYADEDPSDEQIKNFVWLLKKNDNIKPGVIVELDKDKNIADEIKNTVNGFKDKILKAYDENDVQGVREELSKIKSDGFNSIKESIAKSPATQSELGLSDKEIEKIDAKKVVHLILDKTIQVKNKNIDNNWENSIKFSGKQKLVGAALAGIAAAGIYTLGHVLFNGKRSDS